MLLEQQAIDRPLRQSIDRTASAVELAIYDDLAAVEDTWRKFEKIADCTVFQTFDWLAAWQRHVGERCNVAPAVVVGRRGRSGEPLLLLPLGVWPGLVRQLSWLGSDLCDYNAPLLAAGFSDSAAAGDFPALWGEACKMLQQRPHDRHDLIVLDKMPEIPNGAHFATLSEDWDQFYQAKCSRATRHGDRAKRRRLGQFGEVKLVTPQQPGELSTTLEMLFAQKAKAFARMGIPDIFSRAGYREFFIDMAVNPATRGMVHVSRLDVGGIPAAINFGLIFRSTYYHLVAGYDGGELSRFGPRAAHLRELLRHAIDVGCRRFDFTIGDEPYKARWSDKTLKLYDYTRAVSARKGGRNARLPPVETRNQAGCPTLEFFHLVAFGDPVARAGTPRETWSVAYSPQSREPGLRNIRAGFAARPLHPV
jgi:CelD/BcsL family acetyltransferase involved in cellulose biosynthesis